MSDPYAKLELSLKGQQMNKTIMELVDTLIELRTKRDNRLYPSLDNKASATTKALIELSVWTDWEVSKTEIANRLLDEITLISKELGEM